MNAILVIDDKRSILESLDMFLTEKGLQVLKAPSGTEGMAIYNRHRPDVVILDLRLPDADGIDLLERIQARENPAKVIIITVFQDMETTIRATKLGAYDYLHKPLDMDKVEQAVDRILYSLKIDQETSLKGATDQSPGADVIVGRSDQMCNIFKTIGLLSQNRAPVLIQGETGTGKELIARVIHRNSLFSATRDSVTGMTLDEKDILSLSNQVSYLLSLSTRNGSSVFFANIAVTCFQYCMLCR